MALTVPVTGHEIYVYYRAAAADAASVEVAVRRMQAGLCERHAGLSSARMLYRPEPEDGLLTWMEVYCLQPGAAFEPLGAMIEQTAATALAAWIRGPRHVERFIACAS